MVERPLSWSGTTSYKNGGVWESSYTFYPTALWATVTLPSSGPRWNDRYSVILSTYDDLGYYDQLGFASCYSSATGCQSSQDQWTVDWEVGSPSSCGGTALALDWVAQYLVTGATYTFEIGFTSSVVYFFVFNGSVPIGSTDWSASYSDSAGGFTLGGANPDGGEFYVCGGTYYQDFTAWEEVYSITSSMSYPQWNFNFTNLSVEISGSARGTSMPLAYNDGPSATPFPFTYHYNSVVEVANEVQSILFPSGDTYTINPGSGFTAYGHLADPVYTYCSSNSCPVGGTVCFWPSGWSTGNSCTSPTYAPGSLSYTATAPTGASSGWYYIGWSISFSGTGFSPTQFTTFLFYVYVT
jgi:hypothetical protein